VNERRRARRRSLPYVRSAVLEVAGRKHVVAVADLSPEGAFLACGADIELGAAIVLRMVLPRDGREVTLPCRVARRVEHPAQGQKAGLAVRFVNLEAAVIRRIEEFSMEGFLPAPEPTPSEHFEYRMLERRELDVQELNSLGLDGWLLVTTLPSAEGLRLVLMRRL
jgi:hypothetical protein